MKNKTIRVIWLCCLLCLLCPAAASGKAKKERPAVNVKEVMLGHLKDSYEWHLFSIGDKKVTVPLPIIIHSKERGWFFFMSNKLEEEPQYKGFYYAKEGMSAGKVVEKNTEGKEVRPFDISLSKDVVSLFFSCGMLIWLVMALAKWYKKKDEEGNPDAVPTGLLGFFELFAMNINESVIKSCIGKDYKRYSPYLLTAFFFIFINNLLGLVPLMPAGANLTGNISVTLVLALATFIAVNVFGNKAYWKDILWPDVPVFLKAPIPIMPIIEFFGLFTKPMALMIRLFANIFAGHCIILALTCLVFLTAAMGPVVNGSMSLVAVLFSLFMLCLEILVAYIQAYVFTMLSAVFIGMSRQEHHSKEKQLETK